jgi:hypothetical protein
MKALENQMISVINSLKPETEFLLRDIISNPPALLGRVLHDGVTDGTIPNVIYIGNQDGVDKYKKI